MYTREHQTTATTAARRSLCLPADCRRSSQAEPDSALSARTGPTPTVDPAAEDFRPEGEERKEEVAWEEREEEVAWEEREEEVAWVEGEGEVAWEEREEEVAWEEREEEVAWEEREEEVEWEEREEEVAWEERGRERGERRVEKEGLGMRRET
ncbi:hypothetical protein ACOMHN_064774 [Nucella lapillus]